MAPPDHEPLAATKLTSFRKSASIAIRPVEEPVEEPVVTEQPCPTPSIVEVDTILEKELASMAPEGRVSSWKRSASLAVRPIEETAEEAAAAELPCPTPSREELDAMLERELASGAAQAPEPRLSAFKRSVSLAVRPLEAPVEEPPVEVPVLTPNVQELEALLDKDQGAADPK